MSTAIEILILLAILVEIAISLYDRKKQDAKQDKIIELLEDSKEELVDLVDTVAEDK